MIPYVPFFEVGGGEVVFVAEAVFVDPDFSDTFSSDRELSIIVDKLDFDGDNMDVLDVTEGVAEADDGEAEDEDAAGGGVLTLAEANEVENGSQPGGKGVYLFGLYKGVGRGDV